MWYKMSFFEHSARVPLILAGPGVAQGQAENSLFAWSICCPRLSKSRAGRMPDCDGRSLMPLMRGEADPVDEAFGEYFAEMTGHPVFMITAGAVQVRLLRKRSAPTCMTVQDDPGELTNLAGEPSQADRMAAFQAEAEARWNSDALRAEVIASQQARFAINRATAAGSAQSWDHDPPRDAANEYVRNHIDWNVAADRKRFPPL